MSGKAAALVIAISVSLISTAVLLAVMIANTIPGGREPSDGESLGVLAFCVLAVMLAWSAWLWRRHGFRRHALAGSLGASVVMLGTAGFVAAAFGVDRRSCSEVRADIEDVREARRDAADEDPPTRAQLIADGLIRCQILRGLDRQAVDRLLGRPDASGGWSRVDLAHKQWEYELGANRGWFAIDSEWLTIRFDGRGRARRVSIVQD
jgi:hypothetical protein